MKRVPLASKPMSLKDIQAIDDAIEEKENQKESESGNPKAEIIGKKKDISKMKSEVVNKKSEHISPKEEVGKKISEIRKGTSEPLSRKSEKIDTAARDVGNPNSEIPVKRDKADFEKVSATLDPRMVWLLEDERRRRKLLRMDYSFSEIMREALTDYFVKIGVKVDF